MAFSIISVQIIYSHEITEEYTQPKETVYIKRDSGRVLRTVK